MKKLLAIAVAAAFIFTLSAAEAPAEAQAAPGEWEFLSICFFPNFPEPANEVAVNGVKLGIPVSFGTASTVNGVEVSFGASMSNEVNGVQTAPLFNTSNKIRGLQFSVVNVVKNASGVQLGLVNFAQSTATQIGLLNFIKESPLGFMIIFNCRY